MDMDIFIEATASYQPQQQYRCEQRTNKNYVLLNFNIYCKNSILKY